MGLSNLWTLLTVVASFPVGHLVSILEVSFVSSCSIIERTSSSISSFEFVSQETKVTNNSNRHKTSVAISTF